MGATAAEVRAFAKDRNISVGRRGVLSKEAVEAFNKGKRADKRYVRPSERTA